MKKISPIVLVVLLTGEMLAHSPVYPPSGLTASELDMDPSAQSEILPGDWEYHKFYLSVTQIQYDAEEDAFQIIMRIFTDDLEVELFEVHKEKCWLDTQKEIEDSSRLIELYTRDRFHLFVDGEEKPVLFVGHKYELDQTFVYLEVPEAGMREARWLEVQNELLLTAFDDQKNMTHVKLPGTRKTWVLRKGNIKEKLNIQ